MIQLTNEQMTEIAEALCHSFHCQKWESVEDENGSDVNRIAWKNAAMSAIAAYDKIVQQTKI